MNAWILNVWLWAGWWLVLAGARGADYYVSPAGDDAHDGRGSEPARAFRTIQHGVDVLQAGDRLLVRAGTYRETVTFHRDGEPGAPIVVMAYPGEQPVISGLEPLTGWTSIGNDRWTTTMSWTLGRGRDQLFAGERPLLEARFPNTTQAGLELRDEKGIELPAPWPHFGGFSIPRYSAPYDLKTPGGQTFPAGWWDGAIYVGQHWDGWQAQCAIVESSEGDGLRVTSAVKGWWYPSSRPQGAGVEDRGRGMLLGHLHALDAPDEWVRGSNGVVTLQVAAGSTPANIEAKRRQVALDLTLRRHIEVRGLHIFGASAKLREARACTLQGCSFEWLSHFTWFAGVTGDILESGFFDPAYDGETGVYVSGVGNTVRDSVFRWSAGSGVILDGHGHTVHNCLIEHAGYAGTYLGAIWIFGDQYRLSGGHRIARNTLRYSPRQLVGFFGIHQNSPSDQPLPYDAMLFEGNHLHTGMFIAHDGGVFYACDVNGGAWNGRKTLLRRNVVHDCRDGIGAGIIYLDADCWNFDMRDNLLWSAPGTIPRPIFFSPPSMGCTRQDNVFYRDVVKDPASLSAADFPRGERFAFGHDHANPPPVPAWTTAREWSVSAARCVRQSAGLSYDQRALTGWRDGDWAAFDVPRLAGWSTIVVTATCGESYLANFSRLWPAEPRHVRTADPLVLACPSAEERSAGLTLFAQSATNFTSGSWMRFKNVALGAGFRQARLGYAVHTDVAKRAELRLDRVDGPVVASVPLTGAAGTTEPPSGLPIPTVMATAALSPTATGTHDLYFVVTGDSNDPLIDVFQILLENYRGTLPMAADEVRLEVRANDENGPLLATLYPGYPSSSYTPGATVDWVATLDTTQATVQTRRVCLVVHTPVAIPDLRVFGLRLQRAPMR